MGKFGPQTDLGKELHEETDGLGGVMTLLDITRAKPEDIPPELLPCAERLYRNDAIIYGSIGVGIIVYGIMADDKMGALIGGGLFLAPAIDGIIRRRKILGILSEQKPLNMETGEPLNPA